MRLRRRLLPGLGLLALAGCGGNRPSSADAAAEDAAPAPIAADDSATTTEGVAVSVTVLANDADPAGAALSVVDVTPPAHGTAVRQPDGTVKYTPAPVFTGTDSFRYTIAAADRTASATVTVTVVGPVVLLPKSSITADEVGVIVNDADPQSTAVAAYYLKARAIPADNLIHVRLPLNQDALTADEFAPVKAAVDAATPDRVQAYATTARKTHEKGLIDAIVDLGGSLIFLDDAAIHRQPAPSPSAAGRLGLAGVAEPCALAISRKKELVWAKENYGRVTVAIAR